MNSRARKLALSGLLALALPAAAQVWKGKGRLEGLVLDADGKPVANAKVELRLSGAGPNLATDKKGRWASLGLASGTWDLDVTAEGFMPAKLGGINVSEVARTPPIEVKLKPMPKAEPQEQTKAAGVAPEVVEAVKAGDDALKDGKYAEAAAAYEKARPALPDHVGLLMQIARAYHGAGNDPKAIEALKTVVDKEPTNTAALLLLGNLSLQSGDLDGGKSYLDRVPASAVTDPTAYINIGILYLNKKKAPAAEDYFSRAITLDATYADGYYYRGLARLTDKKNAEAKADFTKYLELAPNGPEAKEVKELLSTLK